MFGIGGPRVGDPCTGAVVGSSASSGHGACQLRATSV